MILDENPPLPRGLSLDIEETPDGERYFELDVPEKFESDYYRTNLSSHIAINKTHLMMFRLAIDLNENILDEVGRFMGSSDLSFRDTRLLSVGQVSDNTKKNICHIVLSNLVHEFKLECESGLHPVWVYFRVNYEKVLDAYLSSFHPDKDIDYEEFLDRFDDWWSDAMADAIDDMKTLDEGVMERKVPLLHFKLVNLSRVNEDEIADVMGSYFTRLRDFDYGKDSWTDVLNFTHRWIQNNVDEVFELFQYSMRDRLIDEMDEFYENEWGTFASNPDGEHVEEVDDEFDDEILSEVRDGIEELKESERSRTNIMRTIGGRISALLSRISSAESDDDKIRVKSLKKGRDMYRSFLEEVRAEARDNPQDERRDIPESMYYCDECEHKHYQDSKPGYEHREYAEGISPSYYKMEGDTWAWAIPAMSERAAKKTAEVAVGEEPDEIEEVDVTDDVLQKSIKKISPKTREKVAEKAGVSTSDFFIFNPPIDYPTMDTPLIYMGGTISVTAENKDLNLDDDEYMMAHVNNETIWIVPFERIGEEKSKKMEEMVPDEAIDDYELFNNEEYDSVSEVEISLPSSDSLWNDLGEVTSEVYTSDKEGLGEDQKYIHHHDEDNKPRLYQLDDIYVIAGGKVSISDWVYD